MNSHESLGELEKAVEKAFLVLLNLTVFLKLDRNTVHVFYFLIKSE